MCSKGFCSSSALLKHTESSASCFGANPPAAVHHGVSQWEASRNQHHTFTGIDSAFLGNVTVTSEAYNSYSGMWECSMCSREFNSQCALTQHVNSGTHDSKKNYTCSQCGKGFSRMSALTDHAFQKHGQSRTTRLANVLTDDLSNMGTLMLTDGHSHRAEATLRFDGGCKPNPGCGGCGFVLQDTIAGWILEKKSIAIEEYPVTNNVAEYEGLVQGMLSACAHGIRRLRVEGDAQLLINQMNGVYAVNSLRIRACYLRAKAAESEFQSVTFHHIPRATNWEADELASSAVAERQERLSSYGY